MSEEFDETHEDWTNILGLAMARLLDQDRGVVVHYREHGYFVGNIPDETTGEYRIKIVRDETVLKYGDRDMLNFPKPEADGD